MCRVQKKYNISELKNIKSNRLRGRDTRMSFICLIHA